MITNVRRRPWDRYTSSFADSSLGAHHPQQEVWAEPREAWKPVYVSWRLEASHRNYLIHNRSGLQTRWDTYPGRPIPFAAGPSGVQTAKHLGCEVSVCLQYICTSISHPFLLFYPSSWWPSPCTRLTATVDSTPFWQAGCNVPRGDSAGARHTPAPVLLGIGLRSAGSSILTYYLSGARRARGLATTDYLAATRGDKAVSRR